MSVIQAASTTKLWVNQISNTFLFGNQSRLMKFAFLRKNRPKLMMLFILLWAAGTMPSYLLFNQVSNFFVEKYLAELKPELSKGLNEYFKNGVDTVSGLASASSTAVLGQNEEKLKNLISSTPVGNYDHIAVTDNKNIVLAHTQASYIKNPYSVLHREILLQHGNINIEASILSKSKVLILFIAPVTFMDTEIGRVYLSFPADVNKAILKYKIGFIVGVLIVIPLFLIALFELFAFLLAAFDSIILSKKRTENTLDSSNKLGPYVLKQKIATGGMAELFIADHIRDDGFKRTVAVKRVLSHLSENQEFIRMFIREARLAAILQHPNIVQVSDFGKHGNSYYIVMEYVQGKNLAEVMSVLNKLERSLGIGESTYIISQVANGLHYSHTKKDDETGFPLSIVHRDVSPQNILISFQGEVKISDFGISKVSSISGFDSGITQAGVIKGKLCYLSPEQACGENVDHRADIYSLGIVFYEILSGKRLIKLKDEFGAMRSIPDIVIPPLNECVSSVPDELNRIVMKCLEKDKEKRYQTAKELFDDLVEFKNSSTMSCDMNDLSNFMQKFFK